MDLSTDSELDEDVTATQQHSATGDIQVKNVPAIVTWQDNNGDNLSLADLDIGILYKAGTSEALVKLQANTRLKKGPSKPCIYLFIKPDQIRTLTCVGDDEFGSSSEEEQCRHAREKLGTSAHAMRFELQSPATFVVPPEYPYKFFRAGSQTVWRSWKAFAQDTLHFIVHIPMRSLSKARLARFCQVASGNEDLVSLDDIASLYGGKGGRIIDPNVDDDADDSNAGHAPVVHGDETDAPPAYEERKTAGSSMSGIAPPLCLSPEPEVPSRKRRRRSSTEIDGDKDLGEKSISANDKILQILFRLQKTVDEGKVAHEATLSQILAKVDKIECRLSCLEEQQQNVADEIACQVEPLWDEMSARLQSQEDREHDYIKDMIDEAFDEKIDDKIPDAVDQYFKNDEDGQSLVADIVAERIQEETREFLRHRQIRGHFTITDNE
ncbi:hypothetical protein BKA67DRAFT_658967 [Truncatella angustata]|uniref:Uncharacterized protein n=1 Tax=Truncatella angustata TaxID=152316 RepID=A0A9P8UM79_9PEZI|nr:uncharacterized protein BKA67DRAFT_658967 [Truncatella angustata]KAH6654683.1 hypothetical protein BKA67DRAFT_658967 [Truncatella angustata]